MIARTLAVATLLLVAAVAQTALLPLLPTGWFRPDLLLLVVVAAALADGPFVGLRIGFAAGLLGDLLTALSPAGVGTLVLTVIGFATGTARPYLAPTSLSAPLIVTFATALVGTAAHGTLALLLGDERLPGVTLVQVSFGVAIFNLVLAPAVLGPIAKLLHRLPRPSATTAEQV